MERRTLPLNALRAFEATIRTGTLARAADELCVTPSAVGHQVKNLEDWLGAPLFQGDGARRRPTPEGERFAHQLTDAFGRLDQACRTMFRASLATELHVNVTPTFAIRWLVPRLGRFQSRYPAISVHIATSAAPVDFERAGTQVAIRFGDGKWPGMAADLLFMEDVFPVCHPKFLSGTGALADPRDLKGHTLLHTFHRRDDWPRWLAAAGVPASAVDPAQGQYFDLTTMALDAAEAGLGIAITREAQVQDAIESGRLVAPFRRDLLRGEGCYILTAPSLRDTPAVRAFRDWILEEAGLQSPAKAS